MWEMLTALMIKEQLISPATHELHVNILYADVYMNLGCCQKSKPQASKERRGTSRDGFTLEKALK